MATTTPVARAEKVSPELGILPSPPRVDVYRNLNDDCLSVRNFVSGHDDYGNVIAHTDGITLSDVTFVIQESSQEDAKENFETSEGDDPSGSRNLHALARGHCVEYEDIGEGVPITYQPFNEDMPDKFATLDGRPVQAADTLTLWMTEDGSARMKGVGLTFDCET